MFYSRLFSKWFYIVGEGQVLERVLNVFAMQYFKENPDIFPTIGTVRYILGFIVLQFYIYFLDIVVLLANALVLLNTDLYNKNNKKKMKKREFLTSIQLAIGEDVVPSTLLKVRKFENTF